MKLTINDIREVLGVKDWRIYAMTNADEFVETYVWGHLEWLKSPHKGGIAVDSYEGTIYEKEDWRHMLTSATCYPDKYAWIYSDISDLNRQEIKDRTKENYGW